MESFPKYLINLKRRFDRLKHFINKYPLEYINIIYGFDGKNIKNESEEESKWYTKFSLSPGERGCFITHMRIYSDMIKNNIEYALIMEDDAIFCDNFKSRFETVMSELPKDFHILHIGGRFESEYKMNLKNCSKISERIVQHKGEYTHEDSLDLDRTSLAYVISNKTARLLFESFHTWTNIVDGYDNWMMQTLLAHGRPIFSAWPLLCYSPRNSGNSDIR